MKIKLSENIRAFRKEHAMTQEQLAQELGITAQAVSKWETGQSYPDITRCINGNRDNRCRSLGP